MQCPLLQPCCEMEALKNPVVFFFYTSLVILAVLYMPQSTLFHFVVHILFILTYKYFA